MSYILDALRRSQAERERGQVPGLGTQALPVAAPEPTPRRWPVWALAAGLGLGLLALLLWLLIPRPAEPLRPADAAATAAPGPAPAALSALPPATPAVTPPATSALTSTVTPPGAPPNTSTAAPKPALVVVSAPVNPQPAASTPGAPPAEAERRAAIPLAQLSPEQRRDWPTFSLGGTVWSESPASRFVIANGQVVREGEAVVPGLVLERIAPKTLLLRWRGLQVLMPH